MREIKFRAWDKETGDMIYSDKEECNYGFKLECGVVRCYFCDITVDVCGDEYIEHVFLDNIMQCVGLKDKNDVEIYEGDILKLEITEELKNSSFTNSNIGKKAMNINADEIFIEFTPSKFLDIKFDVYMKNSEGINRVGRDIGYRFPMYIMQKGGIVVGNIYENKYLLQ